MPQATLTFTLPDEESEHRAALQGAAALALLCRIDQCCRTCVKYGDPAVSQNLLAEDIRRMIHEADGVTLE